MKKWILLLMFLTTVKASAQNVEQDRFWSFSYLGHLGFQPGLRAGLEMPLIKPCPEKGLPDNNWIIRPQLGFFANPGDDRHIILNTEVGIKKPRKGKNSYRTFTFGLGYLNQSKLRSTSINLGTGNTDSKQRVSDHFLLPTINYEYGWATHKTTIWFSKLGLGRRLLGSNEDALMLFVELGIKLKTKKN